MNVYSRQFLILLLIGALVVTYFIFQPFLAPLIMAAVFAVLLHPLYLRMLQYVPRWPSVVSLLTVLIAVLFVLIPLSFIGTQVGLQAARVYTTLTDGNTRAELRTTAEEAEKALVRVFPQADGFSERLTANVSGYGSQALSWIVQHLGTAFASVASLTLSFFVFFVALYYLLRDGESVKKWVIEMSPLNDAHDAKVFDRLERAVNSVIKGSLTIALLQGIVSGIGYTIFGVPNAVLWGTVTAIAALIPGVGTALIITPIILFMAITGNMTAAIGLTIWGVAAVGLIDNLLGPKLIGSGIKLHPLLVLLSVLGGVSLFGPMGIFLGPLALSLVFALLSIYRDLQKGTTV